MAVPATGLCDPQGVAVDKADDVFIAEANNSRVLKVTLSGTQITVGSGLGNPFNVAVDRAGDIFIADTPYSSVVEVQTISVNFGSAKIGPAR